MSRPVGVVEDDPMFRKMHRFKAMFTLYQIGFCSVSKVAPIQAMFTLYRIGFCSFSKVAPVQCEQELMFCCGAEIVPKRSQCEQKPYPLCNLLRSLLI